MDDTISDYLAHSATRPRPAFVEQFLGIIRSIPCHTPDADDYSDARYYVDRAVAKGSSIDELSTEAEDIPGLQQCLTAVNLAELADGSHRLPEGTLVQVFALFPRAAPGRKIFVFHHPPAEAVVVKIIAAVAGAGQYDGRILGGAASASAATNLVMPSGLTVPSTNDALVLNLEEDGVSGHRLAPNTYAIGAIEGSTTESPPRKIVLIRGGVGSAASATTIGAAAEGSETADTASWTRAGNATPLNLFVVSRVVYNATGDKTLYQFFRQLSFDARGLLLSVSAETRVTVDTTESCP